MLLVVRLVLTVCCVLGSLMVEGGPPGPLPTTRAGAAVCARDVVVLGTDLTAAQHDDVVARLGAPTLPQTLFLSESLADERVASAGVVPAYLLGVVAISSARLTRRPAGAGLSVQTDPTVTFDTAAVYANALLTAGVHDARVQVTAPTTGHALGTTALVGLLRAAAATCLVVPSDRAQLALREVVLTTQIGNRYGAGPAAALLRETQRATLAGHVRDGASLGAVVDRTAATAGMSLLPATRATLISLVGDLVDASHRYPDLATPPDIQVASVYRATAASPRPPAATPPAQGQVLHGVTLRAAAGTLQGMFGGQRRTLAHVVGHLVVTRNDRPAHLDDVRPGDQVTVRTAADGRMVRLAARGPAGAPRPWPVPTASPVARPRVIRGVVTTAATGMVTYVPTGGQAVRQAAGLTVTRNGRPATLAELRPGDRITLTRAASGRPVRLDARGAAPPPPAVSQGGDAVVILHGTVRSAAMDHLTFTNSATGRDWALAGAFGAVVMRNHHPHLGMAALRPGDGVTVVLDRRGRVRAIDARGAFVGATATPPAARPRAVAAAARSWLDLAGWLPLALAALVTLVLLGLLLWVLLWLARLLGVGRRRLPFALVERRAGPADDAAPPASYDLRRDARVLCADREAGRLAHVVVLPETGALLRLIIRDRSKVLRTVPASVVTSAGPSSVRLEPTLDDLLALLDGAPSFSTRRYRALLTDQHHAPDAGVVIESTPTSLQITVKGGASGIR